MDKRTLLKARLPTAEVPIPGAGVVKVRALSRGEVIDNLNTVDRSVSGAFECRLVAMSMVSPKLTDDEVREWRANSEPHEIMSVLDAINRLSALTKDAAKAAWKELESSPDLEFRDAPGGDAVDDGGPAEG